MTHTLIDRLQNLASHLYELDSNSGEAQLLGEAVRALKQPVLSGTLNLLPCPFCGSPANGIVTINDEQITTCGDESDKCQVGHRNFTIKEWNSRAPARSEISEDEVTRVYHAIDAAVEGSMLSLIAGRDNKSLGMAAARAAINSMSPKWEVSWLPIDTCPKERKAVLVRCSDMGNVYVVWWNDLISAPRWFHFGSHARADAALQITPTHWMPVPAFNSIGNGVDK